MEQYLKLKKLLKELEKIRGRHTELVTVYIPAGYSITDKINQLKNEQGTASNIKSKTTRKNVMDALEKAIQHLKLYKKTPDHGLALFSGNVSEREGVSDIRVWAIEPPEPINVSLYWCDQKFELEPLKQQLKEKDVYGLLVLDTKEATIGVLKGKNVRVLKHLDSIVPGKFVKGGQSAARFQRVREGLINDWYKQVAEVSKEVFSGELKGILIGGPGMSKEEFYKGNYLPTEIKKKVLGIVDTGYTNEEGLHELIERGADLIKEASVIKEKKLCKKFFAELRKDSGKVVYGVLPVVNAVKSGAAETVLISEGFDWQGLELICACGYSEKKLSKSREVKCPKCGQKMRIVGEEDGIDAVEQLAKLYKTNVVIISRDTPEGEQLYQIGGIGAILRWEM